jgi:hypothetical protein
VFLCVAGFAAQSTAAGNAALTAAMENDYFTATDNSYTNGFSLTWVSGDLESYGSFVSSWGRLWGFLPFVGDEGYATYAAWSVAQEMHTPNNISLPDPPATEQPYAGILYLDSVLYARSGRRAYAWELKLGIVGPASQADDLQKKVHELLGGAEPKGWDTQLPNEPVINIGLTTAGLLAEGGAVLSARWRLVPIGHVGLGTYFTGAALGMDCEVGWNLVDALGGNALREGLNAASTVGVGPVHGWSVSFYGGLTGAASAHYLPLDGTVFKDSRSVDTKPFIGAGSYGLCVRHGRLVLSLAKLFSTKSFETQEKSAEWGTLGISWYL